MSWIPERRQEPNVVYLVRANTLRRFKIGCTSNLRARLSELQTGCPTKLVVMAVIRCDQEGHARRLEKLLHWWFSRSRPGGEWFWFTGDARYFVRRYGDTNADFLIQMFEKLREKAA